MVGWMDGWMDGYELHLCELVMTMWMEVDEFMNRWMNGQLMNSLWINKWVDIWVCGSIYGWTHSCIIMIHGQMGR